MYSEIQTKDTYLLARTLASKTVLKYNLLQSRKTIQFLVGAGNFFCHCVQNSAEAYPTSYPMVTRGFFPGVKQPGHEAD